MVILRDIIAATRVMRKTTEVQQNRSFVIVQTKLIHEKL